MTILTITAANINDIKKAKPGDTLVFSGPVAYRSGTPALSGVTFDFTNATFSGLFDISSLTACAFVGGRLTSIGKAPALTVSGTGISISGISFAAGLAGQGYGIAAENVSGLKVTNCVFDGMRAGLKLGHVRGADIGQCEFVNAGSDGINMGDCWDVDIHNNWFYKFAPLAGNHPDAVQCNTATDRYPRCQRVTVRDNVIEGECQGMLIRDVDGVLVARNAIRVGQPTAIGVQNCTDVVIDSNGYLRTLETAPYQAHIDMRGSEGHVTFVGMNEAPAFRNTKRVSYA